MLIEASAFAVLGLTLLTAIQTRTRAMLAFTVLLWNSVHIVVFYLGLTFTTIWTWLHSASVALVLGACNWPVFLLQPEKGLKRTGLAT